ncbi:dihydroneopterin aldolase [Vagococcus carniphilus]|uniref:7,8-dihydroneopterin aldolase n=1 Tax=Vagococcus carniphilus TaxID=218144 RepID=A0A430B836_9ENTE|nr:dihydroneopterin aldolase [Vagococcus carniphilus]MDT2814241.1 dihydroneopterin aldolase [Vagococcus carniphilus]MDT2829359.1 dihydroneopterin aldolase [Vagococcus carniphilus]MDT2833434.1 dihydroneopterin aldolase [Vagococcus carniphilus]MDT2838818.1 dihydroneopterin aldolase [Vagococcus carniphilus]MDT2852876.1 dihydroneopterin aldolase [Vagococcus carniphilus]
MGKIRINNLKFYTKNGVLKEERVLGQQLEIDVELTMDINKAGKTDNVQDTVSYAEVNDRIHERLENSSFDLMEAVASAILDDIENDHGEKLDKALIRIRKYSVPMPGIFDNIEIEMEREMTK